METRNSRKGRQHGFNLVELMVVVAIVGILGMVAYPSFLDSVRQSRRTDAHTALMLAANNLERFFTANNTYTTDETALGFTENGDGDVLSDSGHYTITVTAGGSGIASSYVVTAAAAAGDGQQNDTGCTTLTVDSTGRRTPDPTTTDCW